jgi:small GTP-binding protein
MMTEMKHLKSKICLLGEKAVGKTSLIRRYVLNMFDDHYITTIGTKVSKKEVRVFQPEKDRIVDVDMTVWDIMGEKGFRELLKEAYFYGANGILAVCDVTRRKTLDDLDDWIDSVEAVVGKVPILIAVNKADLMKEGQLTELDIAQGAKAFESEFVMTSAKTGEGVEEAFRKLALIVAEDQLRR